MQIPKPYFVAIYNHIQNMSYGCIVWTHNKDIGGPAAAKKLGLMEDTNSENYLIVEATSKIQAESKAANQPVFFL